MADWNDREMEAALIADGEKLRQLTGEDHGPWDFDSLPLVGISLKQKKAIAFLAHNLRHSAELIDGGAKEHGSYNVPWNVLSWSRDVAERGARTLANIIGPVCTRCDGVGFIDNPDARYERDRDTGNYETNDPEEVDCPECGGSGFPQCSPESDPLVAAYNAGVTQATDHLTGSTDDDMPF